MISCFMNGQVIRNNCKKTLRDCSQDDQGYALSNISDDVVDFDNVKKIFCDKHLKTSYTILKSVDTYLEGNNNQIFLIEFKNAQIDKKQKYGLNIKLKDSLLILTNSFGFNLKDFQERLNTLWFIVNPRMMFHHNILRLLQKTTCQRALRIEI